MLTVGYNEEWFLFLEIAQKQQYFNLSFGMFSLFFNIKTI